jgi:hypothetical protein
VVLDYAGEQPLQLAPLGRIERREQRVLRLLDAGVEPLQQAHPGRRQPDHVATAVLIVALARDQAVALQVADHRDHVAAVDQQAPAQRRLAGAVACVAVVPAAGVLFALAAGAERAGEPALAPATP